MRKPWVVGIIIGFLAAFMQFVYYIAGTENRPPAFGFTVVCHVRDLMDTIWNGIFGTSLGMSPISSAAVAAVGLPILSIVGALLGAFFSALIFKEFRLKKASVSGCIRYFAGGFLFMLCALIMGACPYRIALRLGYGDMVALIGLAAVFAGVVLGILIGLKRVGGK